MQRAAASILGAFWATTLTAQFQFQEYTSSLIDPQFAFDPSRSLYAGGFNGASIAFEAIDWQSSNSTAWVQTIGVPGYIPVELDDSQFVSDSVRIAGLNASGLIGGVSYGQGRERPVLGRIGEPMRAIFDDPAVAGYVRGISANSDVAVGTARFPNAQTGREDVRGFIVRDGNVSFLDAPAGAVRALPRGVSPNGRVIAGYYLVENGTGSDIFPALWIDDVFTPLPMTAGTPEGMFATDVNDNLEVSGYYDPLGDIPYARMWTYENGQHEAHFAASGFEWWPAIGIDGNGVAAASAIFSSQDPILFHGDEFVSLADQLIDGPSANWLRIVHDSGSIIGTTDTGEYVLIRPVPSPSACVALFGGLMLARRRKR